MSYQPNSTFVRSTQICLAVFVASFFFSTALMNISALFLCCLALPFVWQGIRSKTAWIRTLKDPVAASILGFLLWLTLRNGIATQSVWEALRYSNDFRPFLFILLFAPLFRLANTRQTVVLTYMVGLAIFCIVFGGLALIKGTVLDSSLYHRIPDITGPALVIGIVAALEFALSDKQSSARLRQLALAFAILGAATLILGSTRRTGYVSLILCFATLAWWHRPTLQSKSVLYGILSLAILLGGFALSPTVHQRTHELLSESKAFFHEKESEQAQPQTSSGQRLRYWTVTQRIIAESPIFGVGTSQFANRYAAEDRVLGGIGDLAHNPHNEYLYILASNGLIGLILYLLIPYYIWRQSRKENSTLVHRITILSGIALYSSILFNSMIIDMVPGHLYAFLSLVLLSYQPHKHSYGYARFT